MDYTELSRNGWVVVLIVIVFRETIPAIMNYFAPGRAVKVKKESEIEERSAVAMERIAENTDATRAAVAAINAYMATLNLRLSKIESALENSNRSLAVILDRMFEEPPG